MITLFFSICMMTYVGYVRPFKDETFNNLEFFNEFTVIGCLIMCFIFTDFVDDAEIKRYTGWVMIFVVLFNISVNIITMLKV